MESGTARKIVRVPLYPLIGLGKGLEKGLLALEEHNLRQKLNYWQYWLQQHHLQPLTGGMGTGTGFALGIRIFDDDFLHRRIRFEMPLRYSTNNYQQFGTMLGFSLLRDRKLFLDLATQYRSRPQEDFFGLGDGSFENDRTNYKLQDRNAGAVIGTEIGGRARFDFGVRYTNTNVSGGEDDRFPSTEQKFPSLAGLARGSSLLRYGFSAMYTALDNPLDPKKGFRWRGRFYWVDSLNSDNFDFYDYGLVADGYVPLGRRRTLAVRLVADFRQERDAGQIPFYLLPYLGGSRTMRGFREFRFYDANALLVNIEYRHQVWKFVDFVLFTDQGQVAREPGDFSFERFRTGYGAGLRVKSLRGVALRFDVGRSSEGWRFYFTFSPEF